MSDIRFHCAICGTALTARAEAAGAVEECRACGRHVPVPSPIRLDGRETGCAPAFPEEILGVELKFRCTRCATKLGIDVRWEGREVPCPRCHLSLTVPRWSQPARAAGPERDRLLPLRRAGEPRPASLPASGDVRAFRIPADPSPPAVTALAAPLLNPMAPPPVPAAPLPVSVASPPEPAAPQPAPTPITRLSPAEVEFLSGISHHSAVA